MVNMKKLHVTQLENNVSLKNHIVKLCFSWYQMNVTHVMELHRKKTA